MALALGLAMSLMACTATQQSAAVGTDFAHRATDVCRTALAAKQAWDAFPVASFDPTTPNPSALPVVADWLDEQVTPTFTAWEADLRDLGAPPTGQERWKAMLGPIHTIVQANADQVAAARSGDADAFAAATAVLQAAQAGLERAAAVVGAPACAEVHDG